MADIEKFREFYNTRKKMQRRKLALTAMAAVSITLMTGVAVAFAVMLVLNRKPEEQNNHSDTIVTIDTGQSNQTSPPTTTSAESKAEITGTAADATTADTAESAVSDFHTPLENYDYTKPVPKSRSVDVSYYDDALFIGDSRTEGFRLYAGLNNATYYAVKGLTASTAFTEPFIAPTGDMKIPDGAVADPDGKLTVAQALEYDGRFGKIYIMFGINELGWKNVSAFIDRYKSLVELTRKYHPDAFIYVQLILPVSKSKSDSDNIYNNDRITMFNNLIAQMCADEKVFCVNAPEAVAGADGALPEDAGVDGVHMKRSYCELWRDYLTSHTVDA